MKGVNWEIIILFDHIIRNEKDYYRIWKYIDENILKWSLDKYYNE